MKLLEYEAKQLLADADINTPRSTLLKLRAIPEVPLPVVLKSQVPVGGRGKAGGVRIVETEEVADEAVNDLFNLAIKGYTPQTVLAEEKLAVAREFYLSLVINRSLGEIQLVANTIGGVEVEDNTEDSYLKLSVSPRAGSADTVGQALADYYDLPSQAFALQDLVEKLYRCFVENDATLLEINPLILTKEDALIAGDCKMTLDDSAAFRHPGWQFETPSEAANFVILDQAGSIATIANGAGLAMATVDAVADYGMKPANFLDIGGGANAESVLAAFTKILEFSELKGIVINIFAGITRCDEVAKAIITAKDQLPTLPPLFIRLAGTNYEAAVELLEKRNITILPTLEACLRAARAEVSRG